MGYDTVSIASMNSAREGINSLPREARGSYLERLLNGIQPDIAILPGDTIGKTAFLQGYGQFMSPDNEGTLMLFDINKIQMKEQNVDTIFNDLFSIEPSRIAWPKVQVSSLQPTREVVKTFTAISFHYELFNKTNTKGNEKIMRNLAIFAQRVGLVTNNPILIAGEIRLPLDAVRTILSELNNSAQQLYLTDANAFWGQRSYLPSMVKGSTREHRQLFKLSAIQAKRETIVSTWSSQQTSADCFIASKALDMTETKGLEIEQVLGQQVEMRALKQSYVAKTEMNIPVRPPRHHGG